MHNFAVPFALFFSVFSIVIGFYVMKQRRAGIPPPYATRGIRVTALLILLAGCFLLGVLYTRTIGN
jgi:hypothetical protein